jgi:hypothetical protein
MHKRNRGVMKINTLNYEGQHTTKKGRNNVIYGIIDSLKKIFDIRGER